MTGPDELSFLAAPGQVADWRMVVLADAAAEAGLLDALPGTAAGLAARLGLDADAVRVVLDALAAWDAVAVEDDGTYVTGPAAVAPAGFDVLHMHATFLRRWTTGVADRLRGPLDVPTGAGRPAADRWQGAMAAAARRRAPALVDACIARFPDAKTVLDLGGGHGEYSLEFCRRGLQATMQDLPEMVDLAAGRLAPAGVALFAGDFFERLPDGPFDLVFCAGINHTMSGARNAELFRRVWDVGPPGGGMAVFTFMRGRHRTGAIFAVHMLLNSRGGDTHSEADYRHWLTKAGWNPDGTVDFEESNSALFATRSPG